MTEKECKHEYDLGKIEHFFEKPSRAIVFCRKCGTVEYREIKEKKK